MAAKADRRIALLRGVNVGTGRKVAMADLRALLADEGLADVATYVQSGNAVFTSKTKPAALETALTKAVSKAFGFAIPVMVRTHAELRRIAADDPFDGEADDPAKHLILFSSTAFDKADVEKKAPADLGDERYAIRGRELHLWLPGGAGRSKLAVALSDRRLEQPATGRNRRTVERLLSLAAQD